MSREARVSFTKREQALLRLASRRIRRLVLQLNEQERIHREMLIERDSLKSKIIRLEVEANTTTALAVPGVEPSPWKPDVGRRGSAVGARLSLLRLAPQRTRESARDVA